MRYFAHWLPEEIDAMLSPFFTLLEEHKIHQKKMDRYFILRAYKLKNQEH
ncbi:MAG: hypothetical protein JSR39_11085 [Verrucomicrobia bacterium]|nr:hypothetical protein [Verrucomicrobiota bacterium]